MEAPMGTASIEENRLKEILKSAIVEVLEERRDLVVDLFEEAIEDVALARAIEEGQASAVMSREEVFKIFEQGE
jgi:ribosomal protein L12E/L44/L45/RPP1/RPP2